MVISRMSGILNVTLKRGPKKKSHFSEEQKMRKAEGSQNRLKTIRHSTKVGAHKRPPMIWRCLLSRKLTLALAVAVLYQSLRNVWNAAESSDMEYGGGGGARRAETTFPIADVDDVRQVDVEDVRQVETIFVVVVSMQRSSSTFLSHQVLTGQNHSKPESPINFAPPMATCPLRHFITLNEVFTNHPQQSGDAWKMEGAELVQDGTNPKDLTVEQLSDFLQRVAERRCREAIDEDLRLYKERDPITQRSLLADCPNSLRHHQCSVSYKHFDFHLPVEKHDKVWKTLIPNLRLVILERRIEDRWSSFWVAQQTGDWNVHGTEEHKAKLAELKKKVPAVPDYFRNLHDNWYGLVRKSLSPGGLLEGVPRMDLEFYDVVAEPLEVRSKALDMIWNGASSENKHLLQRNDHEYDPQKHPTGSFANCSSADGESLQPGPDTVTVSCKTFHYKLVEESFRNAGSLYVGVLSAAKGKERRQAIRETWANEGGVFFLVAGPWEAVKEEFDEYGDLIWLNFEENYRSITEKTASFFYLLDKVTSKLGLDYTYAAKVDDDTYVAQDRLLARLGVLGRQNGSPMEFWGRCGAPPIIRDPENQWYVSREQYPEENYPVYCQGGGYALSKNFIHCAASEGHIASIRYFDFEDVYVGMLAERCRIDTSIVVNDNDLMRQHRSGWRQSETRGEELNIQQHSRKVNSSDSWLPEPDMARRIIQHNVFNADDMRGFHGSYLNHKVNAPSSVEVGDVLYYYYDKGGVGWLEGSVKYVAEDEHKQKTVSMDFGPSLGEIEGLPFDEAFSGRWSRASSSHRFTTETLETMKSTITELENLSVPYYIYTNTTIDQSVVLQEFREKDFLDPSVTQYDHIQKDMMAELNILEALKKHSSRVHDSSEAELFVVPTPITELALRGCHWDGCAWFNEAFDALEEQESFKANKGNNHILIATAWLAFNHRFRGILPALSRNYRRLRNVTVAHHYDPYAVQDIQNDASRGYEPLYELEVPVTRAFSLGLGYDKAFDIRVPSYENFENSEYFLFYHSRNTTVQPFSFQTTKYRDAPFNKTVLDVIPTSSIGGATSKERWLADFQSSKFCLVVRGDTPHSHAFLYSVRAGCIPVIVSDNYPQYAGPLKSSLSMKDFSIFINEEDFLKDPLKELLKLQNMSKEDIKNALEALAMAQRIIFPDHARSLFVPAFLRELKTSQELPPPPLKDAIPSSDDLSNISITIQNKEFQVRFAQSTLSRISTDTKPDKPNIVVAVITKGHRFRQRQAIRASWKNGQKLIFFAFNGNWTSIEKEFMEDGDIVWVRNPEITHADRALLAMSFIESHVPDYDYVLKINDSGCAYVNAAQQLLQQEPQEYWGACPGPEAEKGRNFGYFLSKKLNQCSLDKAKNADTLPQNDGVATRQLAQECGVTCSNKGWEWLGNPEKKMLWFMEDNIEETGEMMSTYWNFMIERKIGEWAEG